MSALRNPLGGFLRVLLPMLVLAGFVTGGRPEMIRNSGPILSCGSDLMHPLQVTVIPDGPIRPGAAVTASVRITSRRDLDAVRFAVQSPADVVLLSRPGRGLGRFRAGEVREEQISLIAHRGKGRRVVQILVEGEVDGLTVTRGAVLNLVFEDEPSRLVITPDGRQIHEVRAEKKAVR